MSRKFEHVRRLFNSSSLFKRNNWHVPGILGRGAQLESQVLLSKALIFEIAACGDAVLSATIEEVHYKNYENVVTRLGGQVHQILFFAEVHSGSIAIVRHVSLGSERPRCSCVGVSTKAGPARRQVQSESGAKLGRGAPLGRSPILEVTLGIRLQRNRLRMNFLGLTKRKECCVPTLRGWLVLVLAATFPCVWTFRAISPFLAPHRPVESRVLAVEGWLPDYALEQALGEFRKNHHELLVVTGPPLEKGYYLFEYKTYADLGAATLKHLGLEEKMLVAVPSVHTQKDRTFTSGLALKQWLQQNRPSINAVNVVTLGVHARRTWLLFEKALGLFGWDYRSHRSRL
jgi:hypothetical protein